MIRQLRTGDEKALEDYLLPRIDSSMFLLGNMRSSGLEYRPQPYHGFYAGEFEGGKIIGAAACFWNGNLIFQAGKNLDTLWKTAAQGFGKEIKGLIGPNDQVSEVLAANEFNHRKKQLDETENLYSLNLEDLIVPEALISSSLQGREAVKSDLEMLTAWRVGYSLETLGDTESDDLYESCRESLKRGLNDRSIWVLEVSGRLVSMTGFNIMMKESVQVGGVYTPPNLRSSGFGRAAVAASLLDAKSRGVEKAVLFTSARNTPAQKAYKALGFRRIGKYRLVLFT